jgi:hypothetical protein
MRIWQWLAGATLLGAGAVAVACSNSSGSSSGGTDGGEDVVSAGDTGSGSSSGGMEAAACMMGASVATFDGGAAWSALVTSCMALPKCATDCICNNAVLAGLECIAAEGGVGNLMIETACFTSALTPVASNMNAIGVIACLQAAAGGGDGGEGGAPAEGGGDTGAASDATGQ